MWRFLKRLFQDDKKLAAQDARIEQLEFRLSQLQADKTLELQQSRIDQLESKIEQLQATPTPESQQSRLDQLEKELSDKIAILEHQQVVINELSQRLEVLERQDSAAQPLTESNLSNFSLDINERLARLEQQLNLPNLSDENEFIRVTSIDKVSDISPENVYFTSLKEMLERYRLPLCYPDNTFRGDKALSREEFVQHIAALTKEIQALIEFYKSNT